MTSDSFSRHLALYAYVLAMFLAHHSTAAGALDAALSVFFAWT